MTEPSLANRPESSLSAPPSDLWDWGKLLGGWKSTNSTPLDQLPKFALVWVPTSAWSSVAYMIVAELIEWYLPQTKTVSSREWGALGAGGGTRPILDTWFIPIPKPTKS